MTKPSIPIPVISHPDFVNIPIAKTIYKINTFDDGNQQYVDLENKYYKIGYYKQHPEKIALLNINMKTLISSISEWKVSISRDNVE